MIFVILAGDWLIIRSTLEHMYSFFLKKAEKIYKRGNTCLYCSGNIELSSLRIWLKQELLRLNCNFLIDKNHIIDLYWYQVADNSELILDERRRTHLVFFSGLNGEG